MNITLGTIFGAFFVGMIKALIFVMQVLIVVASLGLAFSWIEKMRQGKEEEIETS